MDQETINKTYTALGELIELLSAELRKGVEPLESMDDIESFRQAQQAKEAANLLDAQVQKMKKKHPHLFADEKTNS